MKDELLCIDYNLHLLMLKKIYFGDKILFLSDEKTDVVKPFLNDKNTVTIRTLEKNELKSIIANFK